MLYILRICWKYTMGKNVVNMYCETELELISMPLWAEITMLHQDKLHVIEEMLPKFLINLKNDYKNYGID